MEAIVPPKRRLTLNGLHGVISKKILFKISLVFGFHGKDKMTNTSLFRLLRGP
jgi:hypothetical protein